ncbi:MAG: 2-amino-4-hydroxy-6-hydroxymethyldihydropteridine pyrophosphokinae [Pseudonocardiales bacterium]|nr:2-amino-4-hydroxy-6-hydroxymethyldihydropteridine pyrophosphokinae [Jatrophihabitantaceae bacterium]MCW2603486.1 2-amino-4-hydroxy-6-hydroxymethyldihydropteridine pyrophosphokinae [Pseudonocardiales bacterium]
MLSLGSNLGDRAAHLRSALARLGPAIVAVSPVFQTPPWGPVEQDDFLNIIAIASDDDADADDWLLRAQACEQAAGRVREVRWGPRTLDVDIVTVVDGGRPVRSDDPVLTLPHPRAFERAFVLVPWLALDPGASLPGHGSVADLVGHLDPLERDGVRLREDVQL